MSKHISTTVVAPGVTLTTLVHNGVEVAKLSADSLQDLVRYVDSPAGKPKGAFEANPYSRTNSPSADWDLGAGFDGAKDLALNGWPKGRERFTKALSQLPKATGFAAIPESDIAGGVLDCASFVAGDPCHFDCDPEETFGQTRLIRLLVPIGANCLVTGDAIANRGAAIASLVDAIEAAGYQCEIDGIKVNSQSGVQVLSQWRIKSAGEHLNLDFLATSVAHPATARRIGFAALEACGGLQIDQRNTDAVKPGYGHAAAPVTADLEPAGTIVFPEQNRGGNYETPAAARATINRVFEQAGYRVEFLD